MTMKNETTMEERLSTKNESFRRWEADIDKNKVHT